MNLIVSPAGPMAINWGYMYGAIERRGRARRSERYDPYPQRAVLRRDVIEVRNNNSYELAIGSQPMIGWDPMPPLTMIEGRGRMTLYWSLRNDE